MQGSWCCRRRPLGASKGSAVAKRSPIFAVDVEVSSGGGAPRSRGGGVHLGHLPAMQVVHISVEGARAPLPLPACRRGELGDAENPTGPASSFCWGASCLGAPPAGVRSQNSWARGWRPRARVICFPRYCSKVWMSKIAEAARARGRCALGALACYAGGAHLGRGGKGPAPFTRVPSDLRPHAYLRRQRSLPVSWGSLGAPRSSAAPLLRRRCDRERVRLPAPQP